ncbi:50S ribosomal protein L24 [bacterium]|nr:MAG: 50S ribosomal protein L24 [bacterium]
MKKKPVAVAPKIQIRKDDLVVVLTGKYKDRKTPRKVLSVLRDTGKVLVEGVNVVKDAPSKQSQRAGDATGLTEKTMPIDASNVQLVDSKGVPTRVRLVKGEDGKRTRVSVKSGETIYSRLSPARSRPSVALRNPSLTSSCAKACLSAAW